MYSLSCILIYQVHQCYRIGATVAGVGLKTALKLIKQHLTLDAVLVAIEGGRYQLPECYGSHEDAIAVMKQAKHEYLHPNVQAVGHAKDAYLVRTMRLAVRLVCIM